MRDKQIWGLSQEERGERSSSHFSKSILYIDSLVHDSTDYAYYLTAEAFARRGLRVASILWKRSDNFSVSIENKSTCLSEVLTNNRHIQECSHRMNGVDYFSNQTKALFSQQYSENDFLVDVIRELEESYDIVFVNYSNDLNQFNLKALNGFDQVIFNLSTKQEEIYTSYDFMKKLHKENEFLEFFWVFSREPSFQNAHAAFMQIQKTFKRFFGGNASFLGNVLERKIQNFELGGPQINRDFTRIVDLYIKNLRNLSQTGSQVYK